MSLRPINISEVRLINFCGHDRTLLEDDDVRTPLHLSTFGTWYLSDPALLTKFDIDMHRSAPASSSLSKSEESAYGGRFSLADIGS